MIGYNIEATTNRFKPVNVDDFQEFLRMIGADIDDGPEIRDGKMYIKVAAYNKKAKIVSEEYLADFGFSIDSVEEFEWEDD